MALKIYERTWVYDSWWKKNFMLLCFVVVAIIYTILDRYVFINRNNFDVILVALFALLLLARFKGRITKPAIEYTESEEYIIKDE